MGVTSITSKALKGSHHTNRIGQQPGAFAHRLLQHLTDKACHALIEHYTVNIWPIQGVGGGYWGLDWKAVLEELQLMDPKRRPFGPVCRATRADGTFTCRALTSAEGTSMLNDFIEAVAGSADETTTHSLKSTTLVWAARYGMDDKSRCLLGHHTTKENSLACYSRDLLAKPLRDLRGMLLNVRLRKFNPDGTRGQPRISSPQSAMKMPLLGVLGQKDGQRLTACGHIELNEPDAAFLDATWPELLLDACA